MWLGQVHSEGSRQKISSIREVLRPEMAATVRLDFPSFIGEAGDFLTSRPKMTLLA